MAELSVPPLTEDLRSNRVPSDADRASRLYSLEAALTNCHQEISRLELDLTAARRREFALRNQLGDYLSLAAPVRRLPVEILREIFGLVCFPYFDIATESSVLFERDGASILGRPFRLASVCKFWRDVTLDFPAMWSCIAVYFHHDYAFGSQGLMTALLDHALERSAKTPLYVYIRSDIENLPEASPACWQGWENKLIFEHSGRFRLLHLYGFPVGPMLPEIPLPFASLAPIPPPNRALPPLDLLELKHFGYHWKYFHIFSWGARRIPSLTWLSTATNLNSVTFYKAEDDHILIPASIARNIDTLETQSPLVMHTLQQIEWFAENLVTLRIAVENAVEGLPFYALLHQPSHWPLGGAPLPTLPKLETLDLTMTLCSCHFNESQGHHYFNPNTITYAYFTSLRVPALRSLSIKGPACNCIDYNPYCVRYGVDRSMFKDFILQNNRSAQLDSLCLDDVVVSEEQLLEIFQLLPNLRNVNLAPSLVIVQNRPGVEGQDGVYFRDDGVWTADLDTYPLSPALFKRLVYIPGAGNSQPLLPKLTNLTVWLQKDDTQHFTVAQTLKVIVEVVESRLLSADELVATGISRLEEVEILNEEEFDEDEPDPDYDPDEYDDWLRLFEAHQAFLDAFPSDADVGRYWMHGLAFHFHVDSVVSLW